MAAGTGLSLDLLLCADDSGLGSRSEVPQGFGEDLVSGPPSVRARLSRNSRKTSHLLAASAPCCHRARPLDERRAVEMTDTTNLVTPKAADAPETFKGDAARPAPPSPDKDKTRNQNVTARSC